MMALAIPGPDGRSEAREFRRTEPRLDDHNFPKSFTEPLTRRDDVCLGREVDQPGYTWDLWKLACCTTCRHDCLVCLSVSPAPNALRGLQKRQTRLVIQNLIQAQGEHGLRVTYKMLRTDTLIQHVFLTKRPHTSCYTDLFIPANLCFVEHLV
jgi:hypothetical protein